MKILIVDDDPLLRRTIARALTDHVVATARSCAEAREHLRGESFSLVLSDLHLTDGLGTEIHSWMMRERIDFGYFALMTGSPVRPGERKRLANYECPVLEKPFGRKAVEDLLALVEASIGDRNVS